MTYAVYRAKQMEVFIFYSKNKNEITQTKKHKKRIKFLIIWDQIIKNRLQIVATSK